MSRPSSSALVALLAAFVAAGGAIGCGGSPVGGIPFVPSEGGIPDRIVYDRPLGEPEVNGDAADGRADGDGADAVSDSSDGSDGGEVNGDGADDGGGDGADADDAEVAPSMIAVSVDVPIDNAIVPTQKPLVPTVTVSVTFINGATADDLAGVNAHVWSTGSGAKMQSSTKLTLTSRPDAESAAIVNYLYAETPLDLTLLASGSYELRITATTNAG